MFADEKRKTVQSSVLREKMERVCRIQEIRYISVSFSIHLESPNQWLNATENCTSSPTPLPHFVAFLVVVGQICTVSCLFCLDFLYFSEVCFSVLAINIAQFGCIIENVFTFIPLISLRICIWQHTPCIQCVQSPTHSIRNIRNEFAGYWCKAYAINFTERIQFHWFHHPLYRMRCLY